LNEEREHIMKCRKTFIKCIRNNKEKDTGEILEFKSYLADKIKAGEIYLGYDLNVLNLDSDNTAFLDANRNKLPDVILVRKKPNNIEIKGKKLKRLKFSNGNKKNKKKMDDDVEKEDMKAFMEEIYDEMVSILHLEVDAKVKPELIDAQGFEAKGVLSEYFYTLKKDDGSLPEAKISENEITAKANELYKKYGEDQKVFMVDLFSTKDDNVVYVIDLGNIIYDANTGKLIHCVFDNEPSSGLSEEKCRQLAQNELDNLDIPGAYLSEPARLNDMGGFIYSYNVYCDVDGEKINLGSIDVDPFSLSVLNVEVSTPDINQQTVNDTQVDDSENIDEQDSVEEI
jgi:hypothetical protein